MRSNFLYLFSLLYIISGFQHLNARPTNTEFLDSMMCHASYAEFKAEYDSLLKIPMPQNEPQRSALNAMLSRMAFRLGLHADTKNFFNAVDIPSTARLKEKRGIVNACIDIFKLQSTDLTEPDLEKLLVIPAKTYMNTAPQIEFYRLLATNMSSIMNHNDAIGELRNALSAHNAEADLPGLRISILLDLLSALTENADYEEAISMLPSTEQYINSHCSDKSIYKAMLNRLKGVLYTYLGDFGIAKEALFAANKALEQYGETNTFEYASTLEDIGMMYLAMVQPRNAYPYFDKFNDIQNKRFGANSAPVYVSVSNILEAARMNQDEHTFKSWQGVIDDINLENVKSHPKFLFHMFQYYTSFSSFMRQSGIPSVAIDMLEFNIQHTLDLNKDVNLNGLLLGQYNLLGSCYLDRGEGGKAAEAFSKELELHRKDTHDVFVFLPENKRAAFNAKMQGFYNRMNDLNRDGSLTLGDGSVSAIRGGEGKAGTGALLYDASLLNKGVMLEASVSLNSILAKSGNPELLKLNDRLVALRRKETGGARLSHEEREIAEALESRIVKESRQYGDFMNFSNLTWRDVAQKLGKKEMAVEFVVSKYKGKEYYSAEILRKDFKEPKHLFLFALSEKSNRFQKDDIYTSEYAHCKIWKKILELSKPGETIYFSPAGRLYSFAAEHVMLPDGKRINEVYNPIRLSSTRELVLDRERTNENNIVLYGGLDYDTSIDELELMAQNIESSHDFMRGGDIRPENRMAWGYLPGTLDEVQGIAANFINNDICRNVTGNEGTEESLKSLSGKSPGILHLATHGYYLPEESADNTMLSNFISDDRSLYRSALVMSGGNNGWLFPEMIPEGVDDGILTAKEISGLDLSGTRLVVMSACQTGLGDITGEGVFGLQRAFKLAGAKTLVMSLSPVHDDATKVLMTSFYKELASGHEIRQAFAKAQESVKASEFTIAGQKLSGSDPRFWASFVIMD